MAHINMYLLVVAAGIQGETYDKMRKIKLRSEQLIHASGQGSVANTSPDETIKMLSMLK